ncbi:hypothetical protein AAFF27_19700 [Xylophilus sp. GW821-FHT01B05]
MIKQLSTRLALGAAVLAASLGTVGVAHAGNVAWSVGVSVPGVAIGATAPGYYAPPPPVYYNPAPVYYNPAPVYVAPRPVYYAPPPVYYAPRPVYYGGGGYGPRGYWGGGPHWHGGGRRDWR